MENEPILSRVLLGKSALLTTMNIKLWEISFGKPSSISNENVTMSSKRNGDVLSNSPSVIVNFGPALVMVVMVLILNQFSEVNMFLPCPHYQQVMEVDGKSQLPTKKLRHIVAMVLTASNVITVNRNSLTAIRRITNVPKDTS